MIKKYRLNNLTIKISKFKKSDTLKIEVTKYRTTCLEEDKTRKIKISMPMVEALLNWLQWSPLLSTKLTASDNTTLLIESVEDNEIKLCDTFSDDFVEFRFEHAFVLQRFLAKVL